MITYDKICALNIRDDNGVNFAHLLCTGQKKIETRDTNNLKCYVGKRLRVNRTGIKGAKSEIVGEITISNVIHYTNCSQFDKDFLKHLVDINSSYHLKNSKYGEKYGYLIENPTLYTKSYPLTGKTGIVTTKNQGYNP